jgi:hypothetical protein
LTRAALFPDSSSIDIDSRTIMKFMPDVDIMLVSDDKSPRILKEIQETAQRFGFEQSDLDTEDTLRRINQTLTSWKNGEPSQTYLPGDIHVISTNDLLKALNEMGNGNCTVKPEIYSLHKDWVNNKEIDFWFDFVFSMQMSKRHRDELIAQKSKMARRCISETLSFYGILDVVLKKSKRAENLLNYIPTLDLFNERVNNWRQ